MKCVKTKELFDCNAFYLKPLFDAKLYPWEIIAALPDYIQSILENPPEGFQILKEGVLVGENVKISEMATIEAPAVIGTGTEIRPGAYIRGNVITGRNCVIGNSTELKNSILLDHAEVPHYNYIGDSILGNHAHMGAGAICSNLKADKKNVVVHGEEEYVTHLRKLGGMLGDHADVGCGCVLNPGTIIGKNTNIYPLTALRGVYPGGSIVKNEETIVSKTK